MISVKVLIKYILLFYILVLPITPIVFSNIRLDYFIFFLLLSFLPFIKLLLSGLQLFIVPGILILLITSYFLISGQSAAVSQLFINFFGFFRIAIIFLVVVYLLNTHTIKKEQLFNYSIVSLFLIAILALFQSIFPSFNDFLLHNYTSTYKINLMEAILSQSHYRLTSTIGHPAGVGLATLIMFSISLNYILIRKKLNCASYRLLYILPMLISLYVGMISGSKVFYIGIILLIIYVSIERKTFLSMIFFIIFIMIFLKKILFLFGNEQSIYVYNLISENGIFSILNTRFGEEGLLTTHTLPYLEKTFFLGSGLFDATNVFYGDNLYFMLMLRFSFIGVLGFILYFLYFIIQLRKQYIYEHDIVSLAISNIFILMLIAGIGIPSITTARISELFAVWWAIGFYIIHFNKRNLHNENLTYNT